MADLDLSRAEWRKSTYSNGSGGSCVETAALRGNGGRLVIAVRDSKDPNGPALTFTGREWQSLVTTIKAGRLDLS
jgi:hypothetical protein